MLSKNDILNINNIVYAAGQDILDIYETAFEVEIKSDNSPLTIADKKSHMTIENGLKTASNSGFTDICLQPDTLPKIDNNSILSFLKSQDYQYPCKIHLIA